MLAAIFKAAVRDRKIAVSPCQGIRLPRPERRWVVPLTTEQVHRLVRAAPERYRALLLLAVGTGLRQSEALGLTVDRVDFLRRGITVDRQLVSRTGEGWRFGPPKTEASRRRVPLPEVVGDAFAAPQSTVRWVRTLRTFCGPTWRR